MTKLYFMTLIVFLFFSFPSLASPIQMVDGTNLKFENENPEFPNQTLLRLEKEGHEWNPAIGIDFRILNNYENSPEWLLLEFIKFHGQPGTQTGFNKISRLLFVIDGQSFNLEYFPFRPDRIELQKGHDKNGKRYYLLSLISGGDHKFYYAISEGPIAFHSYKGVLYPPRENLSLATFEEIVSEQKILRAQMNRDINEEIARLNETKKLIEEMLERRRPISFKGITHSLTGNTIRGSARKCVEFLTKHLW